MKTNIDINKANERDDYLQSLSLKELKKISRESQILFQNNSEVLPEPDMDSDELIALDDVIQKMQLNELKKLFESPKTPDRLDEFSIAEKAKITGLDRNIILLIESKKEKATLEQIMIYCRKLNIPYQQFIPEFFIPMRAL